MQQALRGSSLVPLGFVVEGLIIAAFAAAPVRCAARTVMPVRPVLPTVLVLIPAPSHGVILSSVYLRGSRIG
jgi:hypothetical protein